MNFEDLINKMKEPGEDGIPETIYDDLTGLYAGATSLNDSSQAKIAELDATNAALLDQINKLKTHNYDLLMSVADKSNDAPVENDAPADDDNGTFDDAFDYENED